jgi:hypothetical protein
VGYALFACTSTKIPARVANSDTPRVRRSVREETVMPAVAPTTDENELGPYGNLFQRKYPPIEKIKLDPTRVNTSKDPDVARLATKTREPIREGKVNGTIDKKFVPIDFSTFRDVGYTEPKGSVHVEPHRHPGVMFNLVVDGSVEINGTTLGRFDWYVVPPGVEYSLNSKNGYVTVFGYTWSC